MAIDDNEESIFMGDLYFYGHPGSFVLCFTTFSIIGMFLLLDVKEPKI